MSPSFLVCHTNDAHTCPLVCFTSTRETSRHPAAQAGGEKRAAGRSQRSSLREPSARCCACAVHGSGRMPRRSLQYCTASPGPRRRTQPAGSSPPESSSASSLNAPAPDAALLQGASGAGFGRSFDRVRSPEPRSSPSASRCAAAPPSFTSNRRTRSSASSDSNCVQGTSFSSPVSCVAHDSYASACKARLSA